MVRDNESQCFSGPTQGNIQQASLGIGIPKMLPITRHDQNVLPFQAFRFMYRTDGFRRKRYPGYRAPDRKSSEPFISFLMIR